MNDLWLRKAYGKCYRFARAATHRAQATVRSFPEIALLRDSGIWK